MTFSLSLPRTEVFRWISHIRILVYCTFPQDSKSIRKVGLNARPSPLLKRTEGDRGKAKKKLSMVLPLLKLFGAWPPLVRKFMTRPQVIAVEHLANSTWFHTCTIHIHSVVPEAKSEPVSQSEFRVNIITSAIHNTKGVWTALWLATARASGEKRKKGGASRGRSCVKLTEEWVCECGQKGRTMFQFQPSSLSLSLSLPWMRRRWQWRNL